MVEQRQELHHNHLTSIIASQVLKSKIYKLHHPLTLCLNHAQQKYVQVQEAEVKIFNNLVLIEKFEQMPNYAAAHQSQRGRRRNCNAKWNWNEKRRGRGDKYMVCRM